MFNTFRMAGLAAAGSMANSMAAGDAARDSARAVHGVLNLKQQLRLLEANLTKSLLINEALWELLRDRLHLTEDDLNQKLYQIDMRDGQLDGKNQRAEPIDCPECHRKVSPRHPACIYCGHTIDDSVFRMT